MFKAKKGRLLISEPSLSDDTFFKSVILLTHHNNEESIGLILNQPTNVTINEILNNIPSNDFLVYIGGPVAKNSIQFIHTLGKHIPESRKITDDLYWGGDFDQVRELIIDKQVDPNQFKFFLGYAGWDKPQLVEELKSKSWVLHPGSNKYVFDEEPLALWKLILEEKGGKYSLIANFPEDPILN